MRRKKRELVLLILLGLLFSIPFATGCSSTRGLVGVPQGTASGFLREEFLNYKRVAVMPFEGDPKGEAADAFTLSFHEKFPQIGMVARKKISEAFREADLYPNRMDEATRVKIGKTFDVQALIMGSVYYPSILRWLVQVVIVDAEKGAVLGRSYAEVNFIGAERIKEACDLAVEQLIPR